MKLSRKIITVCAGLLINAFFSAETLATNEIDGYVINEGTQVVHNSTLNPLSVTPFQQSGQTASQYLGGTHYTTDASSKMAIYTSGSGQYGCAFLFSSDDSNYYIAAASLDAGSKCKVATSSSPGFTKKNFLIINVNS